MIIIQQVHRAETTLNEYWFNVMTLNQRWTNIVSTLCVHWLHYQFCVKIYFIWHFFFAFLDLELFNINVLQHQNLKRETSHPEGIQRWNNNVSMLNQRHDVESTLTMLFQHCMRDGQCIPEKHTSAKWNWFQYFVAISRHCRIWFKHFYCTIYIVMISIHKDMNGSKTAYVVLLLYI